MTMCHREGVVFGELERKCAGVAVPLFSLRTSAGVGIGQYPDILGLARWCRDVGLDVIQLLPLNDTGQSSSPYSALSAFALNPVYLDVAAVPGSEIVRAETDLYRALTQDQARVSYRDTRARKMDWLRRIYDGTRRPEDEGDLRVWTQANPWVESYARFVSLKESNGGLPWWDWPSGATAPAEDLTFHTWVQREAHKQLAAATRAAGGLGVRVMGDLPILMSRDSAEVWASPQYFDADFQAGAPPDMFSPHGQNWGFPSYRWEAHARDDYSFWRGRIRHASRFYHAVRIDHVLGFLRIWRIPTGETTGILGHYHPRKHLSRQELGSFDDGRMAWLTRSHTTGSQISGLGADADRVRDRYFVRIGAEDMYHLSPAIDGERSIEEAEPPGAVRDFLLSRHRDRCLLDLGQGRYCPTWYHGDSTGYRSLHPQERAALDERVQTAYRESERIWEREGRRLLDMLRTSTDMLVCAEDLGAVPDCLPPLLGDLGILGLRIERWARVYTEEGHPLIPPERYPRLSVCSPSVHDTTTLRGWWEEPGWDREGYYKEMGLPGRAPPKLTPEVCRAILERAMDSASLLTIAAIQDYLALEASPSALTPEEERVNVPGTVGDHNWSYRMPVTLEELGRKSELTQTLRSLIARRGSRP